MLSQISAPTSLDILRDIIKEEMSLAEDRIFIYGQPWKIPEDAKLFVVIEFKYSRSFSNRTLTPVDDSGNISQEQNLNTQEYLTVQLFSRNFEALQRKEEALMALKSVYSQQLQEKYAFKLSWNGQIQDLTSVEGSAELYRFDVPVVMLTAYQKIKTVQYYDSYDAEVITNTDSTDIVIAFDQPVVDPT